MVVSSAETQVGGTLPMVGHYTFFYYHNRNLILAVSNRWTGLLEWTSGMDFDLLFFLQLKSQIYIEELPLAHAGLACKVVLALEDFTRALNFIIEIKPRPYLSVGRY